VLGAARFEVCCESQPTQALAQAFENTNTRQEFALVLNES